MKSNRAQGEAAAIAALQLYRAECKAQCLPLECSLATLAMAVMLFDDALINKPFRVWRQQQRHTRNAIRQMKAALVAEFPPAAAVPRETP